MVQTLLSLAALFFLAQAAPLITRQAQCPPAHLIIARGSLEPQGPGSLMTMASKIIAQNPGTTLEAVVYPATLDNYTTSVGNGTAAMIKMLEDFVGKCPEAKVGLLGYSQGAQVIGDALGGGGIQGVSRMTPPVGRAISDGVDAMIFYGDPRHNAVSSYNVGTATENGIFVRSANQSLSNFASKLQSYCNTDDPFCASGNNLAVHLAYPKEFDDVAATFVTEKFQSAQQKSAAAPMAPPQAASPLAGLSPAAMPIGMGSPDLPAVPPATSGTLPFAALMVRKMKLLNPVPIKSTFWRPEQRVSVAEVPWSNSAARRVPPLP